MKKFILLVLLTLTVSSGDLFAATGGGAANAASTGKNNKWQGYAFAGGVVLATTIAVIVGTTVGNGGNIKAETSTTHSH